tara:strand:+ start:785 stop:2029 length:1245 start_codon:yes stop_codon:yes gene_type:complete
MTKKTNGDVGSLQNAVIKLSWELFIDKKNIKKLKFKDDRYNDDARARFDYNDVLIIADQIKRVGQLDPVQVVIIDNKYVIVAGHHRVAACAYLGIYVECIVLSGKKYNDKDTVKNQSFGTNLRQHETNADKKSAKKFIRSCIADGTYLRGIAAEENKISEKNVDAVVEYIFNKQFIDSETDENKGVFFPLDEQSTRDYVLSQATKQNQSQAGVIIQTPAQALAIVQEHYDNGTLEIEHLKDFPWSSRAWGDKASASYITEPLTAGSDRDTPKTPAKRLVIVRVNLSANTEGHMSSYTMARQRFPDAAIIVVGWDTECFSEESTTPVLVGSRYDGLLAYERKQADYLVRGRKPFDGFFCLGQLKKGSSVTTEVPGVGADEGKLLNSTEIRRAYNCLLAYEKSQLNQGAQEVILQE